MPATKLAGNTKAAKQCKKGWSCGFTCIAKGKECRSTLPGQAKSYADWMAGQAKPKSAKKDKGGQTTQKDGSSAKMPDVSSDIFSASDYSTKLKKEIDDWETEIDAAAKNNPNDQRLRASQTAISGVRSISPYMGETVAIRDKSGKLLAAASISDRGDAIEVDFLASTPRNLTGGASEKVRGAGTAAMAKIIQHSVSKGHGGKVTLMSLDDAFGFYKKLGFDFDDPKQVKADPNSPAYMTLQSDQAKQLLKKLGY